MDKNKNELEFTVTGGFSLKGKYKEDRIVLQQLIIKNPKITIKKAISKLQLVMAKRSHYVHK